MNKKFNINLSIKNRLLIQLGFIAFVISACLFMITRLVLSQAVTATQDSLLTASIQSLMDKIYVVENTISVDLPYDTFSLLGSVGEDIIFYRIDENGVFLTGYDDFPMPKKFGNIQEPAFTNMEYLGETLRIVAIENIVFAMDKQHKLRIIIAQSQNFQKSVANKISANLFLITLFFFLTAILFAFLTANLTIRPIARFAQDVKMRGPQNLRKVSEDVPTELKPLAQSLNEFISRFRSTLRQTETFIAEAAHHIRTPLSVVRSESELALRKSKTPGNRARLRTIIKAVDQTNRSASQLLDHAMVLYRAERPEAEAFSIQQAVAEIINQFRPAADLKDLDIIFSSDVKSIETVYLDRTLFDTSVRNLLDNALKYSLAESVVTIDFTKTETDFKLIIKNHYSSAIFLDQKQLFKKFRRGEQTKEIVGSGLGLSIVMEAVNIIGASIDVRKMKGDIVCATLLVPC
ncbi:sensor histidine kinase [Alphaproteobacteria bacterium]|nr:sensor histidine kinase [Alphaproteobacteria bacterium]